MARIRHGRGVHVESRRAVRNCHEGIQILLVDLGILRRTLLVDFDCLGYHRCGSQSVLRLLKGNFVELGRVGLGSFAAGQVELGSFAAGQVGLGSFAAGLVELGRFVAGPGMLGFGCLRFDISSQELDDLLLRNAHVVGG